MLISSNCTTVLIDWRKVFSVYDPAPHRAHVKLFTQTGAGDFTGMLVLGMNEGDITGKGIAVSGLTEFILMSPPMLNVFVYADVGLRAVIHSIVECRNDHAHLPIIDMLEPLPPVIELPPDPASKKRKPLDIE
jgi:hypothetical protein